MTKFIELTHYEGYKVYCRIDSIIYILPDAVIHGDAPLTRVDFACDYSPLVRESGEEIMAKINDTDASVTERPQYLVALLRGGIENNIPLRPMIDKWDTFVCMSDALTYAVALYFQILAVEMSSEGGEARRIRSVLETYGYISNVAYEGTEYVPFMIQIINLNEKEE